MKKIFTAIIIIIAVILVSVGGYWGYQNFLAPPAKTPLPSLSSTGRDDFKIITAEGKVKPRQFIQLSFKAPASGIVEEVFVKKGDTVKSGQILARLSGKEKIEASLATAQLEIIAAQQALDSLYENAELAKANAQKAKADAKEQQINAQSKVNYLKNKATQSQIDTAKAALIIAEESLERAQGKVTEFSEDEDKEIRLAAAMLVLYANEKVYNLAKANLNYINGLGRIDSRDLVKAEAELALANAQLNKATTDFELLSTGPDPDQLELVQARLKNANAQKTSALSSLKDLDLVAPFNGTVIILNIKAGEIVSPTQPAAILADLTAWDIETTDLTERDVAFLTSGMQAIVRLDAFPGLEFQGSIKEIGLFGVERRGAANYTITLEFDPKNVPVRWEMTAFVDFQIPQIK